MRCISKFGTIALILAVQLFASELGITAAKKPAFAVFSVALSDAYAISTILSGEDGEFSAVEVLSIEDAVASEAEVLILHDPFLEEQINDGMLDALKRYKIIGIGRRAGRLFGELGLEINSKACAVNPHDHAPHIHIEKNSLIEKSGQSLIAFDVPADIVQSFIPPGAPPDAIYTDFNRAMYIPCKSHLRAVVDVIARWDSDVNYAPIVRQGNYVMIGLDAPIETWTPDYRKFFRALAIALHVDKREPFKKAAWEITQPGTYHLKLAKGRSSDELPGRRFYFQFTQPTRFTAHLEHEGSDNMTLVFMNEKRTQFIRENANQNEPLEITIDITREDIQLIENGYWTLTVTNFDRKHMAAAVLTIEY